MSIENNKESIEGLTASEVSSVWAGYMKGSFEQRFFQYFLETTEDNEIKKIVQRMLNQSIVSIEEAKAIFINENIAIPLGFTDEDISVKAHKMFSDTFTLYFCDDIVLLSLSTFSSAISDCTRKDVRNYFQMSLEFSLNMQNDINDLMLSKGVYLRPPQIALDNVVDFVDENKYLSGFLGGLRPINVAEIANLSRIIHRAQFSKMIFVAFGKIAKSKELALHFSKGRDEIQKVLDSLQEVLEKENIPISASSDYEIFDIDLPPFSGRLMLFFVNMCLGIFCFNMISQAMTSSFRSDIVSKVTKIMNDMKHFYGEGIKLTIKEGWLERPPQSINRKI
ncbi:conserved hypothetical protein [Candidatus Desulfosporosinus infrequens]|uniref:DUF3231 family protein n=1 Tax=Candidatus Desulfosporosinus infrequens TaxID=2043169 RepID=A0A2U3KLP6_9FIRM|nr:conserved hypothetical protein [Candidatus Desulfosporosinus infrequens]